MIYFDNGASSHPKPENVYEKTYRFVRGNGANCGRSSHALAIEAAEKIFQTRKALADFFHVDGAENVVFSLNATYALNTVLHGLIQPGDHVITTDLEHNSVLRPLYALQKNGCTLDIIETDLENDAVTLERIAKRIQPNTKAIVVTQCSNVCGKMLPIDQIAALKRDGIVLVVDGSQGAGSIPTDFKALGIDYYCAPSHKGMLGWQGAGFILCGQNQLSPLAFGGTGGDSFLQTQPDYLPERLEAGTLPIPAIYSLYEGVRYLKARGINNIFRHKTQLTSQLYDELSQIPEIRLYTDITRVPSPGVLSFNVGERPSEEIGNFLGRHGVAVRSGLHCAPLFHQKVGTAQQGMVRVTFGYANTKTQVSDFVKILKKYS